MVTSCWLCQSRLLLIESLWEGKTGWGFVVPLWRRSALVLQKTSKGFLGCPLCFLKLTRSHLLGYASIKISPILFSLSLSERFWCKVLAGLQNINRMKQQSRSSRYFNLLCAPTDQDIRVRIRKARPTFTIWHLFGDQKWFPERPNYGYLIPT